MGGWGGGGGRGGVWDEFCFCYAEDMNSFGSVPCGHVVCTVYTLVLLMVSLIPETHKRATNGENNINLCTAQRLGAKLQEQCILCCNKPDKLISLSNSYNFSSQEEFNNHIAQFVILCIPGNTQVMLLNLLQHVCIFAGFCSACIVKQMKPSVKDRVKSEGSWWRLTRRKRKKNPVLQPRSENHVYTDVSWNTGELIANN